MTRTKAKPPGFWTQPAIKKESKRFVHRSDFKRIAPGAWQAAKDHGIYETVVSHMTAKPTRRLWTKEKALAEAKKYKYKSEFRRKSPGACDAVFRLTLMPLLENHFVRPSAKSKWTYPKILAEARKSSTRTEFFKKSKAAYQAAQRTGVLCEVCRHMIENRKPAGYWTRERILSELKTTAIFA